MALLLSKNANILAASSTAALALVIPVEALKKRNKKVEKKLAYSKIADEDKRILTALGNLQRKNLSTLYDLKIDLSDIETAAQHFGEIWQRALATSQQLIIAFILQTTSRTQPEISSCT